MFVFFTHTTWWPNAATAAQRTGGGLTAAGAAGATRGRDPKTQ